MRRARWSRVACVNLYENSDFGDANTVGYNGVREYKGVREEGWYAVGGREASEL